MTEALSIASLGSFYVGGRRIEVADQAPRSIRLTRDMPDFTYDPNGTYAIDHAYVSYVIPSTTTGLPVVFVHGGGLTGAMWESTPDGRPGWLTAFLRAGRPCYVVDNVERGRAGWWPMDGEWEGEPVVRSENEAWLVFRIGPAGAYERREPYPNTQFPVEHLPDASKQSVPRWVSNNQRQLEALEDVVRKVGPCVLVAHSQGGGIAAHVAKSQAELVKASVLLEPNGLPEPERTVSLGPQVIVIGDNIEDSAIFRDLAQRWRHYAARSGEAHWPVSILQLPDEGFVGNSHNMMMDLNSDEVAAAVLTWIKRNS